MENACKMLFWLQSGRKKIKNALPWWTHGKWSCLALAESRVYSVSVRRPLVVGIFYILCCLFMQRFVESWHRLCLGFGYCFIGSVCFFYWAYYTCLRFLSTSLSYSGLLLSCTTLSHLIVFFLFGSVCLKHDFKLPDIAYFFAVALLNGFFVWCRCCFPFHSILSVGTGFGLVRYFEWCCSFSCCILTPATLSSIS